MSVILSLSKNDSHLWAAGPEGLYRVSQDGLDPIPQPQQNLYCCCAIHDRVLVGGLPHGVAFSLANGENWQASWMDSTAAPVLCLAADPAVEETGVLLAGTEGAGILRSVDRGRNWFLRNFGLHSFTVLTIGWAPPAPANRWPRWQVAFAGTEEGVYRTPNGGRGWRRCEGATGVVQVIATDRDFHRSGLVLAGTEGSGLWRSSDGGYSFARVASAPEQINALAATASGWLLSDEQSLWRSADGEQWEQVAGSQPALVTLADGSRVWLGTEAGVTSVEV